MKKLQLLPMLLLSITLSSQDIPSSISLKSFSYNRNITPLGVSESFISEPSLYVVYEGIYYPNIDTIIEQPVDKIMTPNDIINYMYNLIYRAENGNWMDEARIISRNKLKGLVSSVNTFLTQLSGNTYFEMTKSKYGYLYEGVWSVEYGDTSEYLLLRNDGNVVECDILGDEVQNGKKGTYNILTENRFELNDYFPQSLYPYISVFNREYNTQYFSITNSNIRLKKE